MQSITNNLIRQSTEVYVILSVDFSCCKHLKWKFDPQKSVIYILQGVARLLWHVWCIFFLKKTKIHLSVNWLPQGQLEPLTRKQSSKTNVNNWAFLIRPEGHRERHDEVWSRRKCINASQIFNARILNIADFQYYACPKFYSLIRMQLLPLFYQCSLSIPPENVRKPLVSWRFQGESKGFIGKKRVNLQMFHQKKDIYGDSMDRLYQNQFHSSCGSLSSAHNNCGNHKLISYFGILRLP